MRIGRKYKIEYGDLLVDKVILRPTKDIFYAWLNDLSKNKWFNDYTFMLNGTFSSIMQNYKVLKPLWDIDIIILRKENLNHEELKEVLDVAMKLALIDHSFYLDIYYKDDDKVDHLNDLTISEFDELSKKQDEGFFIKDLFSNVKDVIINGRNTTIGWPTSTEVIPGLYTRKQYGPYSIDSKYRKNIRRGFKYAPPVNIKEFL